MQTLCATHTHTHSHTQASLHSVLILLAPSTTSDTKDRSSIIWFTDLVEAMKCSWNWPKKLGGQLNQLDVEIGLIRKPECCCLWRLSDTLKAIYYRFEMEKPLIYFYCNQPPFALWGWKAFWSCKAPQRQADVWKDKYDSHPHELNSDVFHGGIILQTTLDVLSEIRNQHYCAANANQLTF